jgi:hypothetical protein
MVWVCIIYRGEESCIRGFGGETEGKRLLGRPRVTWEDVDNEPSGSVKCGDYLDKLRNS